MDVILTSDIVILQLEIPFDTVCYVAEKAKEAGKCVILDPAPARELPEELIRGLTRKAEPDRDHEGTGTGR